MSKVVADDILRIHGLDFVKFTTIKSGKKKSLCFKNDSGKRVKGVYVGRTGPLTLINTTNAEINNKLTELENVLGKRFLKEKEKFIVEETSNSITKLQLVLRQFPAYDNSPVPNNSYQNHYIVPKFTKAKK